MDDNELYKELITIEYVLTQGYSDNVDKDTDRLNELRLIIHRDKQINKILK